MKNDLGVNRILDWLDALGSKYDFLLSDERRMIPPNVLLEFGNRGLFGLQIDRKYGGLNLNFSNTVKIIEKIASVNVSLATIVTTHANGVYAIAHYGNDALKNTYLENLSQGRGLAAFALTEACAGSYIYGLETTAEFTGNNNWLIHGQKIWVDSGEWSSIIVTFCKTSSNSNQQKFSAFAVPTEAIGVEVGKESYTMGLKGMVQNQINFNKVPVTKDNLLGIGGDGFVIADKVLDISRLLICAKSLGASKRCLGLLMSYSRNRKISTGILLNNPVTINTIGNISLGILALEITLGKLTSLLDENRKIPSEILMMLKIFATDLVNYSADYTMQALGGRGYMEQNYISQIFRDVRSFKFSEGANEALSSHIGSVLTYAGKEIYDFFDQELNAPQRADHLKTLSVSLYQNYLSTVCDNRNKAVDEYWFFYILGKSSIYQFLLSIIQVSIDIDKAHKSLLMSYLEHQLNDVLANANQGSNPILLLESSKLIKAMADSLLSKLGHLSSRCLRIESVTDRLINNKTNPCNNFSELHGNINLNDNTPTNPNLAKFIMSHFSLYGDQIALTYLNESISYFQLSEEINKVADMLLTKGVQPGDIVGVFIEHSIPLVVTLLSILKIGAIYVPLDTSFPEKRLNYIINDSQLNTIVTTQNLESFIREEIVKTIIILEDAQKHKVKKEIPFSENRLAYIIYTSGSTGNPKGVKITNVAVMNFLLSMKDKIEATNKDVFLMHTSISFDIAVLEIFLPLMSGASVVIVPRDLYHSGKQLLEYMDCQGISVLQATPSFWKMLIGYGWRGRGNLKAISGGEPLQSALAKKIACMSEKLWNAYGPTETTIWASLYLVEKIDDKEIIPIGQPLDNVRFYIVDNKKNKLVQNGNSGEIFISGVCLADGYLNRPDLDKEKFVYLNINNKKVLAYKTGDIGKIHGENLICFGRNDRQVKYNGYRIELGEIENLLMLYDGITSVAVIKNTDENDFEWLVAYYTRGKGHIDSIKLRNHLKDYVPDYMVPSTYVNLKKMPLTHNQKIDYNALPKINNLKNNDFKLNKEDSISSLLRIWKDLFLNKNINKSTDFFDLGGNSLLALRLVSKINNELGYNVSISELYQYSTIKDLGGFIEKQKNVNIQQGIH